MLPDTLRLVREMQRQRDEAQARMASYRLEAESLRKQNGAPQVVYVGSGFGWFDLLFGWAMFLSAFFSLQQKQYWVLSLLVVVSVLRGTFYLVNHGRRTSSED